MKDKTKKMQQQNVKREKAVRELAVKNSAEGSVTGRITNHAAAKHFQSTGKRIAEVELELERCALTETEADDKGIIVFYA